MNDIIFRGKRIDNGEWVEGYYVSNGTDSYIFAENEVRKGLDLGGYLDCCKMYEVESDTVCQWTGSYDKDGVRIFGGDIIEYDLIGPYSGPEYYIHEVGPVIFSDNAIMPLVYCVPDTIRVIGKVEDDDKRHYISW